MQRPDPDSTDIAIIGGGASGLLVAIHLLAQPQPPARIAIVEPRPRLGQGAAYSTGCPQHVLNVVAAQMSAFDADPGHFVRYLADALADTPADAIPSSYARRMDYGRYLHATLEANARADSLRWLQDEAVEIEGADNGYLVQVRSGDALRAERVVLAVGNAPRGLPLPASAISGTPRIANAWDYAAVDAIAPQDDVCVIGSGLSMVDVAISLAANRHRGRISVLSRHGLMPLAHVPSGPPAAGGIEDLLAMGVRERMHALRTRADEAAASGKPWQWTMNQLRPHGQALWQHLSLAEQRRFLRHAVRFWDIHRHRIAPDIAATLDAMRDSGQLHIHAGRLRTISGDDQHASVRYIPRHEDGERSINVGHVINATGVETNLERLRDGVLKSMRERGLIRPGPHGIGVETDANGAVIDANGTVASNLRTLGALRIGTLWESIAIPELRGQAQRIAEAFAE